ncbi:MAG: YafY family transcriptional regulator [Desulfobacteraceae bacterium]|nr:YafY family transcriptional regulator [Desulfobacteraceae bacterium]
MNRIDRLTAILIYLQTRRIVKAKDIAVRFDVSLRTIYRDIRALEEAGVPIGAEAGIGYFIIEGYHLPPVMFTRSEAGAMLIGGKLIEKYSDISVNKHFVSAMEKILAVLNIHEKDYLEQLNTHIEVLHAQHQTPGPVTTNYLSRLQTDLAEKKIITIDYHSAYKDEHTVRRIEPLGLCFYGDHWHLIAFCHLRDDYRDFRVDRIQKLTDTEKTFDPNRHDSLKKLIRRMVLSTELYPAVIRFNIKTAASIRDYKHYYGFVEETKFRQYVEMNFMVPDYSYFATWIITFGEKAKILGPPELMEEVKKLAKIIYYHYHGDHDAGHNKDEYTSELKRMPE